MKRPPRLFFRLAVASALSLMIYVPPARGQTKTDAPAPADSGNNAAPADNNATPPAPAGTDTTAAPATTEPATTEPAAPEVNLNAPLASLVDEFWHYGEVARYDIQASIGEKIIAEGQSKPQELLTLFEQVAAQHTTLQGTPTDLDAELLRWQADDPKMKPVAIKLLDLLNQGRFARRQDQNFIAANIKRLNQGQRAYMLAIRDLRNSGELAVPQMVHILASQQPADIEYHDVVRQALVDLGREALSPLLAATQMNPKEAALTSICGVLGDIGYPVAAPYLVALVHNPQSSNEVRQAAAIALGRLNVSPESNGGDLFYDLAEKFYYGTASIQPNPSSPRAFVWYWTGNDLNSKLVPPQIFNDIMSMRETEHSLRANPTKPDNSVALWLAANIRRSIDLPQGQTDPTRTAEEPQPHYYNVSEGAKYLNLVLDRSLKDNTPQSPAVALAAIKSLQEIVGQSNLFTGGRGQPLVEAMRYADRQVRFEAAFALAAALPQTPFQGQDRVVPLLAEAVSQSGMPGVLIVAAQNDRNDLAALLKGYQTAGGSSPDAAIADSASIPAIDVILMSEDLGNPEIDRVIELAAQNPRLERAAKLIIVHSLASPWARLALTDPTVSYTQATGGPPLLTAIEAARKKAGGLPIDEKIATDFSMRAANLLAKLAISRGQVLDLSPAQQTLIAALGDKRPQIAMAVGEAVALLNTAPAQSALADRANDAATPPDVRISFYKSLATSAKFYGNRLSPNQLGDLQQVVMGEKNLDIRSAAADARGALNLPAEDAKALILQRND